MTAPIQLAKAFGIDLLFYGEDGEVEYGGSSETQKDPIYGYEYQKRVYLEGGYQKVISESQLSKNQLNFFSYPDEVQSNLKLTHWSYFENWDPYRNYLIAKEHCGLKEAEDSNSGTFTNFSQNDQALYALHAYLMYLKFGFGRVSTEVSNEIRRGSMTRDQAINIAKVFDGEKPGEDHIEKYLSYYQIICVSAIYQAYGWFIDCVNNVNCFVLRKKLLKTGTSAILVSTSSFVTYDYVVAT
jgi:hypothetical protein